MSQSQQDHPAYLGCFIEDPYNPDLSGEPPLIITQPEACFTHCSIGTFAYAAIRNRTICTCGDTFNKYGTAPASACSTACLSEQSAFDDCGGPEANSIYSVGLIIPRSSSPAPSVRPPGNNTSTSNDPNADTGDNSQSSGSKNSKLIIIFGAVIGALILVIGILLLLRQRRRRRMTRANKFPGSWTTGNGMRGMNEKQRGAMGGHSWFEKRANRFGGSGGAMWDYDDDDDEDMDRGWQGNARAGQSSMEAQLFEGFESSVFREDQQQQQQYYHNPHIQSSNVATEGEGGEGKSHSSRHQRGFGSMSSSHSKASSNISGAASHIRPPTNVPEDQQHSFATGVVTSLSQTTQSSQETLSSPPPSTFASKIGNKFSHLRVKTGLLQPQTSIGSLPLTPVSPVSPIPPGSTPSLTPSPSSTSGSGGPQLQLPSPPPRAMTLTGGGGGREEDASSGPERSPSSATPSFSLASAPVPGPASNRQGSTTASSSTALPDIASIMPSLEEYGNSGNTNLGGGGGSKHKFMDFYEPPSPISPTLPVPPSPITSSPPSLYQKQQKQHRSNLIKDLILQGDSALEDKEMELMAQYQPHHHHHRQQQQQQQLQSRQQAWQGSGSSLTAKASLKRQQGPSSSGASPSSALLAVPTETSGGSLAVKRNQNNIPAIDTNYLAPPRILIHKAL
ncbi:Asialoglycoprotein receptor 1 [Entomortierella chlamydospora]|uniref:Asialoglycoprotein receptor 1 n=1 Tax=Entomortierella chlamydospora TaxID=101097 RepID=A0A9P6MYF8_9FUNG|nr:Asialoglycoprotein receptor 1 [Entomortierella chlamydospora]